MTPLPFSATPGKAFVGADHAGYSMKEAVKAELQNRGFEVEDLGCHAGEKVDYPDIAEALCLKMKQQEGSIGVLCCGSGVGMSMGANRYSGIRAVLAFDPFVAKMSRLHNNANVLCLGGRFTAEPLGLEILDTWLTTPFEGERHQPRIRKLDALCDEVSACTPV